MRSFKFQLLFTALLFVLSGLHVVYDTNWFGVFSAVIMFFLGLIQFLISFVYVVKGEDNRRIFLTHLFFSMILVLVLAMNNEIDIDEFADFFDHAFLLRIAPGLLACLFLYGLYHRPKRADD
jgi:hypothetical protein